MGWCFMADNCGLQEPVRRLLLCENFLYLTPLVALKITAMEHDVKCLHWNVPLLFYALLLYRYII